MIKATKTIVLIVAIIVTGGCAPRVTVKKNPCDDFNGFRYYRPKPYLLITPAGDEVKEEAKDKPTKTTKVKSDEFVSIELQYLPDFSEEYAIKIWNGLGTSNVSLTLEDGWKLTSVNQQLDAQFDDNVKAIAELVKAGGSILAAGPEIIDASRVTDPPGTKYRWAVRATNIPLGYYESVIGCLPNGKKQLFGWRYVGFAPFNSCPTQMCGITTAGCEGDARGPVYGLAFEEGVMVFKLLGELESLPATDAYHFRKTQVQFGEFRLGGATPN